MPQTLNQNPLESKMSHLLTKNGEFFSSEVGIEAPFLRNLNALELNSFFDRVLLEDVGASDVATSFTIGKQLTSALLIFKQTGIVAGLPLIDLYFKRLGASLAITSYVQEGSFQKAGTVLAKIEGPAAAILTAQRTLLNILQHVCGVATLTHQFVKKIAGLPCRIFATRKTLPGLRALEYYGVLVGGGKNHRKGLYDCAVIKKDHLCFLRASHRFPIRYAVENIRKQRPDIAIEVEVEDLNDLEEALSTAASAIIFTNITPDRLRKCVLKTKPTEKKTYLESRGSVDLTTIRTYAETGVDGITISSITYSPPPIDIRLSVTP